jgi:hypothetical protein
MHYKFLTRELLTLEPCALIAAFQHFILRLTKNFLTLRRVLIGSKVLLGLPSLSSVDMLHATGERFCS